MTAAFPRKIKIRRLRFYRKREKYDGGVSSKDKKQERRFFVNEKIPTA